MKRCRLRLLFGIRLFVIIQVVRLKVGVRMVDIIKNILHDCSTPEEFRFSLYCESCGKKWECIPIAFSKAGVVPETEGQRIIFATRYKIEKAAAFEKAVAEAEGVYNVCPICRKSVCDSCFLICDDLDICRNYAEKLNVNGECVKP